MMQEDLNLGGRKLSTRTNKERMTVFHVGPNLVYGNNYSKENAPMKWISSTIGEGTEVSQPPTHMPVPPFSLCFL